MQVSWTAFKKTLRVGARIRVFNIRRPWLSRDVDIIVRSKRSIVVKDDDGKMTNIPLPAASFTRMRDDGIVELLADEDGPRWSKDQRKLDEKILAGQPYMAVGLLRPAP